MFTFSYRALPLSEDVTFTEFFLDLNEEFVFLMAPYTCPLVKQTEWQLWTDTYDGESCITNEHTWQSVKRRIEIYHKRSSL